MERICVITGGANGIGRCMSETFLHNGDHVVIIDQDEAAGNAFAEKAGEKLTFFHGNVADKETLERFAGEITARFGRVDVLIHNACYSKKGLFSCGYEDFDLVLRIGVAAPFYLTKLLLPVLSQGASIINICSTRAFQSQPNTESYSAAKGGIHALTHAMSVTLAGKARVNAISPGWIDVRPWQHEKEPLEPFEVADETQHSVGRVGTPHDIANLALFLSDGERSGFITGQNFRVDGGMSKLMVYHNDHGWIYQGNDA